MVEDDGGCLTDLGGFAEKRFDEFKSKAAVSAGMIRVQRENGGSEAKDDSESRQQRL